MVKIVEIPELKVFKALQKNERNQLLRDLRRIYSDKDIRDAWGLKYAAYHYYLKQIKEEEKQWAAEGKPKDYKVYPNLNPSEGESASGRKIIDAEYSIVEEGAPPGTLPAVIPPTRSNTEPEELPIMNFKDVIGSSVQMEKRLSSILTLLEMEGEDAKFRINIQVYKA